MKYSLKQGKSRQKKPLEDMNVGLEEWCLAFNKFAIGFFWYMKYIFAFILISIGILTILKLRGIYKTERAISGKNDFKSEDQLRKPRLFLGSFYIVIGLGFVFNFFIYFLMWILDPLPDRFIINFLTISDRIDSNALNGLEDIEKAKHPHEKTIYYCIAIASFGAILDVSISIGYIINNSGKDHRKIIYQMIGGILVGMLFGWTTCLPLLL